MKHFNKKFQKIIFELQKLKFNITKNKSKYKIKKDGRLYITHCGCKSYHPLRRFLKKHYNVII